MRGRTWTIYMDDDLIEAVKKTAGKRGIPVSTLVREALRRFLEEERRREARKEFLNRLHAEEISEEERVLALRAREEYEETERKDRSFDEVFGDEGGA